MQVKILSPDSQRTVDASWIEINTDVGNFVIQEGYRPTIFVLAQKQPCIIGFDNGSQETLDVQHGILEINRTKAMLLLY